MLSIQEQKQEMRCCSMISKKDLKALLNTEPEEKDSTTAFEEDIQREMSQKQDKREKMSLTVIICNERSEHLYHDVKQDRSNTLLCPDVQYLNSVNHLSNVEMIILDENSFSGIEEIGFLIGMFQLLHQNAAILLVTVNVLTEEGLKLKSRLKSVERLYLIEQKDLGADLESKMILCSSLEERSSKKKRGLRLNKTVKRILVCLLLLFALGVAAVSAYPYLKDMVDDKDIYNRNMNVQLDMDNNTILPVREVYSDRTGNHIIIEELTESEGVKIRLYDDEQKMVSIDEQKAACPNKECDIHHVLTFQHDDSIRYYIVQIENASGIRNVEIDNQYFK